MLPKKKDPKKIERKVRRSVDRQKRGLKREEKDLERDERQIIAEIKKAQAKGDTDLVKSLAKNLINVRKTKAMLSKGGTALNDIKMVVKQAVTAEKLADQLGKTTAVMKKVSKINNLEKVAKNAERFQREVEKSNIKNEIIEETLEEAVSLSLFIGCYLGMLTVAL